MMRRLAGIVALLLVLSTAAPVLACMTGTAMGHEENACCHQMHGNCGAMAKSGCCRTQVPSDKHPQLTAKTASIDLHWTVIAWIASAPVPTHTMTSSSHDVPAEHSPPGLVTAKTTVLRL
ncbi:MAG TPA: hypothetical protein VF214_08675 [Edaphobacter sp.]